MNTHLIRWLAAAIAVMAAPIVQAQYDASAGNFNWIYAPYNAAGTAATPYGPPTAQGIAAYQISNQTTVPQTAGSNFQGMGQVAGATSAQQVATVPGTYVYAATYPSNASEVTAATVVLENSYFGGVFTSGVPRYLMGDVMTAPLVMADGVTPAPAGYWRSKPVDPGEIFNGVTPVAAYSVNVNTSDTGSSQVTVDSVTSGVVVGASLLGQPITAITGNVLTLAGNANLAIASSMSVVVTPAMSYYYSPHAEKVYASQPGRVQITWVSLAATAGVYGTLLETFAVSSNTAGKVRKIYWTEGPCDGPRVSVTDGRITTVNPIYNSSVPKAVATEVTIPGYTSLAPNLKTLFFTKYGANAQISAYNVEGRLLVEYLGKVRLGNNIYESIGVDVVDIARIPPSNYVTVNLGQQILPHDGDASLTASLTPTAQASGDYGSSSQNNGALTYYAEKTTAEANSPDNGQPASPTAYDQVVFYWMETGDYSIAWPKYQDHYWLRWSPNLSDYAYNTVSAGGSTAASGISFDGASLPSIVFQDDPAQQQSAIDTSTQRLYVTLGAGQSNRTLLRFDSAKASWYVNLYTQAESRSQTHSSTPSPTTVTVASTAGLVAGMTVTGTGITSSATIVSIFDATHYAISQNLGNSTATINFTHTLALSSTTTSASTRVGVASTAGMVAGMAVTGTGIPASTTIASVTDATHYVLSAAATATGTNNLTYTNTLAATYSSTTSTVTVDSTLALEVGMTVTAADGSFVGTITSITDGNHYVLSTVVASATSDLKYTVEEDGNAQINGTAMVGTRLVAPAGHENAGYISSGTGYYPAGYLDPTVVGVAAANAGAIIPVNALPSDPTLTVRWYKKVATPSADFKDFYVPGKVGRYTVAYPSAPDQIVIDQGVGTNDLPGPEAAGSVYVQNDSSLHGYNPNEEHALMLGGRAYALRDDLNIYSNNALTQPAGQDANSKPLYKAANYTSEPYVLIAYTDANDQRPSIHAYQVLRSTAQSPFNYPATAGSLLVKPYPLPLLPLAMVPVTTTTGTVTTTASVNKDVEILTAVDAPTNTSFTTDTAYSGFTFQDRKGFSWVHRGPHSDPLQVSSSSTGSSTVTVASTTGLQSGMAVSGSGITGYASILSITNGTTFVLSQSTTATAQSWAYAPALTMKLYYVNQSGFFIPGYSLANQPPVGTPLPFLRDASRSGQTLTTTAIDAFATSGNDQIDAPLAITYHPAWPTTCPELRVGETLAQPTRGLPQVRGQKSAQVFYQQSVAQDSSNSSSTNSVILLDPTREKTLAIDAVGLSQVPSSIATSAYLGKTYFQKLPPDLQQRFYFDPMRGPKGTLVLKGIFHDVAAGDKYFDLNLLTTAQESAINALETSTGADHSAWLQAIRALKTTVETFIENPSKLGTYIVDTETTAPVDLYAASDNMQTSTVVYTNHQRSQVSWNLFSTKHRFGRFFKSWYRTAATMYSNAPVIAAIEDPDTAVDSYAVTATGQGAGYVTMVFGNGKAFTPTGDPVQVQVFRVNQQLYPGDLKIIMSSNPLDEQVTLRHSADFAGKPDDYEFDWRWSTGEASAPATYSNVMIPRIGDAAATVPNNNWTIVSDPGALTASDAQYTAAGSALPLPRSLNVHPASYTPAESGAGDPSLILKSTTPVDFSSGVAGRIVFSASLGNLDGCVLYVNGVPALAYNAPDPQFSSIGASSGLTPNGLPLQFTVDASYFKAGANTIEVAIYTQADANATSTLNFKVEASQETDMVNSSSAWQLPGDFVPDDSTVDPKVGCDSINQNSAIIGGDPTHPFGGPQFVLNDRWFTVRYRPKAGVNHVLVVAGSPRPWSRWAPPQFTEGWLKRVLVAINPFTQRVQGLSSTAVNTDVSMLTQAGARWEGNLALNMDNINSAGLIAIYETVLNRAKSMSIDANVNDPNSNQALLLAAGYLNDLYTILGNEAYADAANPTISLDTGAVASSRFSFEGQVANMLDEELGLLRGRDDLLSPGVSVAPAYNRLYWNYTGGINSGEAIYAVNYNIKAATGNPSSGIGAADAQRMFPQGHGDAYGHYLTALTGYYRLLWNQNFTWTPSAEAMSVLGVPVTVDFQDERKFAASANNLAGTAQQICDLTFRQNYKDAPAAGWTQFRDQTPTNPQTGVTRHWGLDETVSRSAQGALVHWAMANAILPDVDTYHTGIQKIDRTTVPELGALATSAQGLQSTLDNAYAHLNPLGLSPGAVPFDINPNLANSGQFSQYYDRALTSLNNAAGAFNQAGLMTKSLRDQTNTVSDYSASIASQETAYVYQLIDVFGRPYSGDIGAGQLYAQGYLGPDLNHWFIVDRPNDLVDTSQTVSFTLKQSKQIQAFTGNSIADIVNGYKSGSALIPHTVNYAPSQWVQYNDVWVSGGLGSRPQTGTLQDALQAAQQSYLALAQANLALQKATADMVHKGQVFSDNVQYHLSVDILTGVANTATMALAYAEALYKAQGSKVAKLSTLLQMNLDTAKTAIPTVEGLATDGLSGIRASITQAQAFAKAADVPLEYAMAAGEATAGLAGKLVGLTLSQTITGLNFGQDEVQKAYEYDASYREVTTQANTVMTLAINHQTALQNVNNLLSKGLRIIADREVFRQRAAAIIQGYRTKDMTFRTFRDESLQQYRSLYDLASRYTYLAAKAYDYETGLLGSPQGQTVFSRLVASRSLGDLTGGLPRATVSTLGDAGLAGTMAQLSADFSVAQGRLGINNADNYNTVFSLRQELFRIADDPTITSDNTAWQQTLEQHIVSNVLNDSDVASQCLNIKKPDGSAVPGIIIPFSTTIESGKNFFGMELCGGDHVYSPSSYATLISNAGIILPGYVGMDPSIGGPVMNATNAASILSATPYVYLIPCGNDCMRAPPLGDTDTLRTWTVQDQAMPLPFNLGASSFNSTQFFNANDTLSSQPWVIRKHQAFRAVGDKGLFNGAPPVAYSSNRLIARSAWNTRWKIVIPAIGLLSDEQAALSRFVGSVTDVQLYLRTYSHAGN
ncbi:MAG: hypothetical protein WCK77_00605 [Verrucomicrobiota bacterium]